VVEYLSWVVRISYGGVRGSGFGYGSSENLLDIRLRNCMIGVGFGSRKICPRMQAVHTREVKPRLKMAGLRKSVDNNVLEPHDGRRLWSLQETPEDERTTTVRLWLREVEEPVGVRSVKNADRFKEEECVERIRQAGW
ncbi:MAG: hypothetical protein ACYTBJ_21530, partial [Planctomycetota bacterium]|jgi:hypothetical protein